MENPMKMDDLGVPIFEETPISPFYPRNFAKFFAQQRLHQRRDPTLGGAAVVADAGPRGPRLWPK